MFSVVVFALLSVLASQDASSPAAPVPVAHIAHAEQAVQAAPLRWAVPPRVETPPKAMQDQVGGGATLRCAFTDGAPTGCHIIAETPAGYGFGMAVLRGMRAARAENGVNGPHEFTLNFEVR